MENLPSDGGSHREKLILREIDRLVKERDDLRAKLNRVERAEAVKESLTSALMKISGFSAYWKCFRGNEEAWGNVWNIATDALISLRTAEESSVVVGERYCHSKYGSANCKWEPGIGCTPKCPECIP